MHKNVTQLLVSGQITLTFGFSSPAMATDADSQAAALEMPVVEIVESANSMQTIPGTINILTQEELFDSHVLNVNEALRKIPGVNVRDEEGFGMRPNIGIRGMNPTRSTKTLLLEDLSLIHI